MTSVDLLFVLFLVALAAIGYFVFASFAFGAGYQPAPRGAVESMLDLAAVGPEDELVDLGAGTGAIVFRAARERGARVTAVEVEPIRVGILRLRRAIGGPRDRVAIEWGSLFETDLREATVVACFLWPGAMARLRPRLESELMAGSRVVSHWHPVPGWSPAKIDREHRVYLYRLPDAARPTQVPGVVAAH